MQKRAILQQWMSLTNLRLKGRKPLPVLVQGYSLSGEPMRHGTNANCIVLPPRILPGSCFGQSYLKTEDSSSAISRNQLWGLQGPGRQGRGGAGVPRSESNVPVLHSELWACTVSPLSRFIPPHLHSTCTQTVRTEHLLGEQTRNEMVG